MPKAAWKEYFTFSKRERKAVFILLFVIVIITFITFWYQPVFTSPVIDPNTQRQLAAISAKHKGAGSDSLDADEVDSVKESYTASPARIEHRLFSFDPNILDSEGWRILGFGEKTTAHILEYRKSKGRFNSGDDLYKVYRIKKKSVAAVLPLVRIGSGLTQYSKQPAAATTATVAPMTGKNSYKEININTAVAEDFKAFPGVTDAVAARIIKFRNSMKGFTSIDDVAKTYGLPDSSFKIMRPYLKLN
ncbi:MAG TPA: helix-hairpin-helix domain-containing protein [Chitinophagaceae bacterium]|jgi:DNA uptake protein ComE-like DNA-binding protein|nr:helix-hairpin-helix domain-containing protein [Chitinophagaceae bacterium]